MGRLRSLRFRGFRRATACLLSLEVPIIITTASSLHGRLAPSSEPRRISVLRHVLWGCLHPQAPKQQDSKSPLVHSGH